MITTEDILNMNFYKKEKFTGSYKGMRYLVKKEKDDAENDIFRATVWPGKFPPLFHSQKKVDSRQSTG